MLARRLTWMLGPAVVIALAVSLPLTSRAAPQVPETPHPVAGYERCLTCHGASGLKPAPGNHTAYPEGACLGCHPAAIVQPPAKEAATPAAPAAPAAGPPAGTPAPFSTPAPVVSSSPPPQAGCLSCHGQLGLKMTLGSGETLALFVDSQVFAASVHGGKVGCEDCHTHTTSQIAGLRSYHVAMSAACQKCHFDNYKKGLDSVHYRLLVAGNEDAPLCTDCHGSHYVASPAEPRTKVSRTCSGCHKGVYEEYVKSVHGEALVGGAGADVPVCTDCHTSHTIADPQSAGFRLDSVQLCTGCHANAQLMTKYSISTDVVKTYLKDFHGRAAALAQKQSGQAWVEEAVCSDCHGVHDIQKVESPDSHVIKANVLATCQKCHPGATANFPSAWLSHKEPSTETAPVVFFVKLFYSVFIPYVLVGLLVYIGLNVWRGRGNG